METSEFVCLPVYGYAQSAWLTNIPIRKA